MTNLQYGDKITYMGITGTFGSYSNSKTSLWFYPDSAKHLKKKGFVVPVKDVRPGCRRSRSTICKSEKL